MLSTETIDNLDKYRQHYNEQGWVRIPNYLDSEFACLFEQQAMQASKDLQLWQMATLVQGQAFVAKVNDYLNQAPQVRSHFIAELLRFAQQNDFQYFYEFIRLLSEQQTPPELLVDMAKAIRSPANLEVLKTVVGQQSISQIDAQLTRYKPGHFLKHHCDEVYHSPRTRKVAYVLGLSKDWQPDWGGLLHIQDNNANVRETLIPQFNALTLFRVPTPHFVSQVTNYCPATRLSLAGWLWE